MKYHYLTILALLLLSGCVSKKEFTKVKTNFQTSREWRPSIDNRADGVMVYGVGGNPSDRIKSVPFEDRVKSWRDRGYTAQFMTGIAWGEYQDYFTGEWDGKMHLDEGQVTQKEDTLWHGHMVPYIVPSQNFLNYIKEKHIKRVIDTGITDIFLEEPEFWAKGGYSDAFKREWEDYYGFPWRPQHESPENTWLSNKLKYVLYLRALDDVFSYAKEYGKSKGLDIKCYVPTHSLINYSQWQIVSPEASLASLSSVDGYIAQVWTGTSREPNYYNGEYRERVFETAFLEYGSMESMTEPTGRLMYFLTDPIEDRAKDWEDYRKNYQATFTAQLLYPNISNFEVMPWPERIYEGLYNVSADSKEKKRIPRDYSTQMQIMINALNDMPKTSDKVSGSHGIGVLMSNSLMFQRFPTHDGYEDPQLANFYGLALPFLKRGVPVSTVHIENLSYSATLKDIKVLLMTYSNMKPLEPEAHYYLKEWVEKGGVIVYVGRDNDPFQSISEWWNQDGLSYQTASDHLFESMGIKQSPDEDLYNVGKGFVHVLRNDPKEFIINKNNDDKLVETVNILFDNVSPDNKLIFKNNLHLSREKYEIISVLNESMSEEPFVIDGLFIDLYSPELNVLTRKEILPDNQSLLLNLNKIKNKKKAQVLATAGRVSDEKSDRKSYSFTVKSPIETSNIMRVLLPLEPKSVDVNDAAGNNLSHSESKWDDLSNTMLIKFDNSPEGVFVNIAY